MNGILSQVTTVLVAILLSFVFVPSSSAQLVGQHAEIKFKNGNKVRGKVIVVEEDHIVLDNDGAESKVELENIKKATYGHTKWDVLTSGHKPLADNYAVMPSARPIGRSNSHYKNTLLFFNQLNFGLTDRFSLGLGFESASLVVGESPRIFLISPKYSFGSDESYFGIGTSLAMSFVDSEMNMAGLLYANYTYGTDRKNVTAGIAYTYTNDEFDEPALVFNVNMRYPLGKNVIAMTEVILGDFDGVSYLFALRFLTRGGYSFDAGFSRFIESDTVIIPVISASIPLSK